MTDEAPPEVSRLVAERSSLRAKQDYAGADALRAELRRLGWEVVDGPHGSTPRPVLPDDTVAGGIADAGALASVLESPATVDFSLQVLVDDDERGLLRFLAGLAAHPPARGSYEIVLVANAPSFGLPAEPLTGLPVETITTRQRLGWADARNLGLRRSRGEISILCDVAVEPVGDFMTPLATAFDDHTVGLAGPWGMRSGDARRFKEADQGEVDALQAYCLAIRRAVLREAGLFDPRFRFYRNADLDFSFQARAAGWRAMQVPELPLRRHEPLAYTSLPAEELERLSKRNFYRFLKRWGSRRDLLLEPDPASED